MSALQNDQPVTLTGDTGVGSQADPNAPATQTPATQPPATQAPATQPPATQAPATGTDSGTAGGGSVELPSDVHGQTAAQYTCSKPFSE
jgi:hypothetical protein